MKRGESGMTLVEVAVVIALSSIFIYFATDLLMSQRQAQRMSMPRDFLSQILRDVAVEIEARDFSNVANLPAPLNRCNIRYYRMDKTWSQVATNPLVTNPLCTNAYPPALPSIVVAKVTIKITPGAAGGVVFSNPMLQLPSVSSVAIYSVDIVGGYVDRTSGGRTSLSIQLFKR